MKIFLSWSGTSSHQVACAFRDWLPSVLQYVKPYVSSEDIDKGARWSTDIAGELEESSFGIICVTRENVAAPWIHFEAGALSKSVEKSRVCPFLFDLKRSDVPQGPLLQFQSVILAQDEILKLLKSVNDCGPEESQLAQEQLAKTFEVWWPQLEEALGKIDTSPAPSGDPEPAPNMASITEELLDLARRQHQLLTDPTAILPREYLRSVFGELRDGDGPSASATESAQRCQTIIDACMDLGWSSGDLAKKTGVGPILITHVLSGRKGPVADRAANRILEAIVEAKRELLGRGDSGE